MVVPFSPLLFSTSKLSDDMKEQRHEATSMVDGPYRACL